MGRWGIFLSFFILFLARAAEPVDHVRPSANDTSRWKDLNYEVDAMVHYISLLQYKAQTSTPSVEYKDPWYQAQKKEELFAKIKQSGNESFRAEYPEFINDRLRYFLKSHMTANQKYKEFTDDMSRLESARRFDIETKGKFEGNRATETALKKILDTYNLRGAGITPEQITKTALEDFNAIQDMYFLIPEVRSQYGELTANLTNYFQLPADKVVPTYTKIKDKNPKSNGDRTRDKAVTSSNKKR